MEQRATAVWCGASVPTFVRYVCVRHTEEEIVCVCSDRCDRCDRWSGTPRCSCSRGRVTTCLRRVLMLTQGGGCTHLIDRKMAASQVCRWCWSHISFLWSPPSSLQRTLCISISHHHLLYVPVGIPSSPSSFLPLPPSTHIHTVLSSHVCVCVLCTYVHVCMPHFTSWSLSGKLTCIVCPIIRHVVEVERWTC